MSLIKLAFSEIPVTSGFLSNSSRFVDSLDNGACKSEF